MNEKVATFFDRPGKWQEEFLLLRGFIRENNCLEEDYKWMHPCYTYKGKNVILIHGFKDYCALLFHKGALLKDPYHKLIQQTENVQSARQLRFTSLGEIAQLEQLIKEYIAEAVEIEKSGKQVTMKKAAEYPMPEEFRKLLAEDEALNKAFYSLTPGRQKGYLYYFNQAKQAKTREARIEKYYQQMLDGKGMDD
ncbi:MAG TPA: DUF1801 domain-containing protein [Cyclobacteriaceae bacterium]|nr:DUF1801 domain-containing protein [Cyclobacteriaceae bacterium]